MPEDSAMGGYDIKASLSAASTTATAVNVGAGTTFNFNSPFASGDTYNQRADPYAPATATSAAGGQDAMSQAVVPSKPADVVDYSKTILIIAGLAAVVAIVFVLKRK